MSIFLAEVLSKWSSRHTRNVDPSVSTEFSYEPATSAEGLDDTLDTQPARIDLCAEIPASSDMDLDTPESSYAQVIAESQPVKCLSDFAICDVAATNVPVDSSSGAALHMSLTGTTFFGHTLTKKYLLASSFLHALMIGLAAFVAITHANGIYGQGGESVMVRFVAQEESVPVEESAGSVDSAASAPSTKGRPDQRRQEEQPDQKERQTEAVEPQPDSTRTHPENDPTEKEDKEKAPRKDEKKQEIKRGDGPVDSVASFPSVASAERRILSAGGTNMEDFQSRILAAIREAIFFPKKALDQRKHGETVVEFVLHRNGSVTNLRVKGPSGSTILDEAALAIVRKASTRFPTISEGTASESLCYVVPIHFKERRSAAGNSSESPSAQSE